MSDIHLKVVPMKPRRKVPPEARPLTVAGIAEHVGADGRPPLQEDLGARIMASIDRIERLVNKFGKDVADLGSGLDYTEARLNRVVRLTKTLAAHAGVPD